MEKEKFEKGRGSMTSQVLIIDDRPRWMVKEDKLMACMTRCHLFKRCSSRIGHNCKRLGGDVIPKVRG
jgi:hypothetical protein